MKMFHHAVFAAILAPALLSGCGKRETPVDAGIRTQTLLVGNAAEPVDLDPHVANTINDGSVLYALFEGLTWIDAKTSQAVPAAAERWEMSPDGLRYTFHLKSNLRWSNGDALTARDFEFAFQRILDPQLGAEYAYMLWSIRGAEAFNKGRTKDPTSLGIAVPNPQTLEVTLERPTPYLPALAAHLTWFPLHRATLEKFGAVRKRGTSWTRAGNLVGNGPFSLAEWRPNARVVARKNPHYWDAASTRLNEIVFFPIESADVEERNFRAGQMHVTWTVPMTKVQAYRSAAQSPLRADRLLGTSFLNCNTAKSPLSDARFRRALALAIDRETLLRAVTNGTREPAASLTPPNCGEYTAQARIRFDPEAARRLLSEAGFEGGAGAPPLVLQTLNSEHYPKLGEALQAMWQRELGLRVALEQLELKTLLQNLQTKSYTIALLGWIADFVDPATFLELFVTKGGNNFTNWSSAEYDRLIAQAAVTTNPTARMEVFQRAEALLLDEMPIVPIEHLSRVYLAHAAVKGWEPSVISYPNYRLVRLEAAGSETTR